MIITDGSSIINYDHPFNQTIINDNSVIQSVKDSTPERVNFMSVFVGGKGRDNVLLKKTSRADFITEYGKPDGLKYGQPILNAYASIVDQYSHAYCMRVMPTDACYSNIIICIKYKNDENNTMVQCKIAADSVGGLNNKDQFQAVVDAYENAEADLEGYKTVPLFGIRCLGRGKYGNSYRIRLANVFTKKKNQIYRTYRLELLDVDEGNTVVEAFEGCMYDYAVNSVSYLMSDVLDGDTNGSSRVAMYVNEEAFEKVYEAYELACPEEERIAVETFDPIFGVNNDKTKQPYVQIDEGVALDRLDGVAMAGGNDGSLDVLPEGKTLEDVIDELYLKAFSGELDKAILSSRRIPVKFMLDANYSLPVKKQIVQLALKRYDALVHLDAGLLSTTDEALAFGEETTELNYRIVSKSFQHYEIRDPFTGKRVPVTMTYDLAVNLARHIETYGVSTPFTGETYATLTGAIKNSLLPMIDESDEEIKEKLYDLKLNYYEAVAENVFARATQQTAQDLESDLSEENNMLMVLEIKDIAERETIARRYNFAEAEDRALFTEVLTNKVKYMKDLVRDIEVYYDMSSEEEARSIIHCYIAVTFKTMAKSSIVEINVNKRV